VTELAQLTVAVVDQQPLEILQLGAAAAEHLVVVDPHNLVVLVAEQELMKMELTVIQLAEAEMV
jgi:hypothetical protein